MKSPKRHYGRWIIYCLLLLHTSLGFSQQSGMTEIKVLRSDNRQPLSDAVVRIVPAADSKQKRVIAGTTDNSGTFAFTLTEPSIVLITYLGFTSVTDTLFETTSKTYMLTPVVKDISDVVVTGQYAPGSAKNSVYEVKVISTEVLRTKGANNLREALQNELHIDLGQDQVFGSSLSINGISGEGIKIMVDGVPIVGRSDGKIDLSQINISNIERIEVVQGPLSVMYGTDAMGGVINIITKTFQTEKVNAGIKAYYESVGQYNIEANTGFSFKKNQVYLSGGRYFFNGYTTIDSLIRFKEWKPKEQYFADAKYLYSNNKMRFSLLGSFFRELMWNRSAPRPAFDNGNWIYAGDDTRYLTYRPRTSASLMYRFKDNYQLDVLLGYSGFIRFNNQFIKNLVKGTERIVDNPSVHDTTFYHHILFRGTYAMPAWKNRINFLFGLEANQELTQQTRIAGNKKQVGDYAAYGSVRLSLMEGLDIQPAVRFSYNTLFRTPLIPSVNVKYGWKDKVIARASYGRGYRAPSLKELFLLFFDSNHSLKGNENLLPEDGHTVNASLNYSPAFGKHQLSFGTSGFYNRIQNKIDWRIIVSPGPEVDTFQYFNIKNYITTGGDLSMGYKWKDIAVSLSGMLTHYRLQQNTSDVLKTNSIDVTASASYLIPKANVGLNIYYKYNGAKPVFSVNSSLQSGTRSAFHSLDAALSRSFWKNRIQIQVGGKNLLGVTNVPATGITGIGHNFSSNAVNMLWGRTVYVSVVLGYSK